MEILGKTVQPINIIVSYAQIGVKRKRIGNNTVNIIRKQVI